MYCSRTFLGCIVDRLSGQRSDLTDWIIIYHDISYYLICGGTMGRALHWTCNQQVVGSNPTWGKSCVTTLDKLFTPMCLCHQGRWCSAAGKVTAGLAKSNGSLPPGVWLTVTYGLTACTRGSAACQTLGNEYGKFLPFLLTLWCRWHE